MTTPQKPELKAWSISGLKDWMQKHSRTDVTVQCGHCLANLGGFKEFCVHKLTCIKKLYEGRDVTPADLKVGDTVTIHHHGNPQQVFCVTETGEKFRIQPGVDADDPPDLPKGWWPKLWLEVDTLTYEQLGGTDECHVCADKLHYNVLLTVPGQLNHDDWSEWCHCGHNYGDHSFHVKFCRQCGCGSFHRPGENNDQITDRWN